MPRHKSKYKKEWEDETDVSGEIIKKWVRKISDTIAKCDLCNKEINFQAMGLTALKRHAQQKKHQYNVNSSKSNSLASSSASSSSNSNSDPSTSSTNSSNNSNPSTSSVNSSNSNPSTSVQVNEIRSEDTTTLTEQITDAEAMWSAMVAEHDIAFLMSDHVSKMVPKMFPDSPIAAGFKCCRTKTQYMLSDGISVDLQEK